MQTNTQVRSLHSMIASMELQLLYYNKQCLQTAVSVCVYQADPVAQIEHDDMMVTIMTICSSCSHYTVSVAVLVPCAAAADQHVISFSRHGILVFALDCLESQGQIPRCILFCSKLAHSIMPKLIQCNVQSVNHICCCCRLQPQANAWLQRGLFH